MAKYPLEGLARVRAWELEQAVRGLAEAVAKHAVAAQRRGVAEKRRDEQATKTARLVDAETAALDRGELRGNDLAQGAAWSSVAAEDRRLLERDLDRLRTAEKAALEAEERARALLAQKRADAELLSKHRERWDGVQRTAAERKEEDLVADSWRNHR